MLRKYICKSGPTQKIAIKFCYNPLMNSVTFLNYPGMDFDEDIG
jgi:hypothetical protein